MSTEPRYLYESLDQHREGTEGDHWPRDFADWRPIPSEVLEDNQTLQALQKAMDSLSAKYREVLVLRDVENLSTNEVATVLGISAGTAKTRLHRARLVLRDVLAPGIDGGWIVGRHHQNVRPW
jgi:RNA polymerase sigma-70 factor, ECF subfamily